MRNYQAVAAAQLIVMLYGDNKSIELQQLANQVNEITVKWLE